MTDGPTDKRTHDDSIYRAGSQNDFYSFKPRSHQQQCLSNIVERHKLNDSFDNVECCFDIVAVFGNNVERKKSRNKLSMFNLCSDAVTPERGTEKVSVQGNGRVRGRPAASGRFFEHHTCIQQWYEEEKRVTSCCISPGGANLYFDEMYETGM